MFLVIGNGGRIHFEVKPIFMNDAEKHGSSIEPVAAEHGSTRHMVKIGQLIQDEVFETVVLWRHASSGFASCYHPHRDRERDVSTALELRSSFDDKVFHLQPLRLGQRRHEILDRSGDLHQARIILIG
jgi:hypothetical protein